MTEISNSVGLNGKLKIRILGLEARFGLLLFALLILTCAQIAPLDDEAYYWVLGQNLAPGYAYHPPATAALIRLAQELTQSVLDLRAAHWISLRFFSVTLSTASFVLLLDSLRFAPPLKKGASPFAGFLLAGFAGLWGQSWMMVPDIPLLFGFSLVWWGTQKRGVTPADPRIPWIIGLGIATALLSKYTGVFLVLSVILLEVPSLFHKSSRRPSLQILGAVCIASVLGTLPSLWWNANHEWSGILYHLYNRHTTAGFPLSWKKWAAFLGTQLLIAGPVLVLLGSRLFFRNFAPFFRSIFKFTPSQESLDPWSKTALALALPPFVIFGVTPAFGDFKPHWMLLAWLPLLLGLIPIWASSERRSWSALLHLTWGLFLFALLHLSLRVPLPLVYAKLTQTQPIEAKHDITNDLFGWEAFQDWWESLPRDERYPWVGVRYQTASLVAYHLNLAESTTLLPRDLKQRDEWPDLPLTENSEKEPLRVKSPFYLFTDHRYPQTPRLEEGRCQERKRLRTERFSGYLSKEIVIYFCAP